MLRANLSDVLNREPQRCTKAKLTRTRQWGPTPSSKGICIECPHPDGHPLVKKLTLCADEETGGVFILDPGSAPNNWRLCRSISLPLFLSPYPPPSLLPLRSRLLILFTAQYLASSLTRGLPRRPSALALLLFHLCPRLRAVCPFEASMLLG